MWGWGREMWLRLKEGKRTCVHFPVITDSSEGAGLLEHVFGESLKQFERTCIGHLLWPALAGAGDTKVGGPQGGRTGGDTATWVP